MAQMGGNKVFKTSGRGMSVGLLDLILRLNYTSKFGTIGMGVC